MSRGSLTALTCFRKPSFPGGFLGPRFVLLSLTHPMEACEVGMEPSQCQQTNGAQKGTQPFCLQLQSLALVLLPLRWRDPASRWPNLVLRGEVNISERFEVLKLYQNPSALAGNERALGILKLLAMPSIVPFSYSCFYDLCRAGFPSSSLYHIQGNVHTDRELDAVKTRWGEKTIS